jgi:hypothetical protein
MMVRLKPDPTIRNPAEAGHYDFSYKISPREEHS